jgi:predicted thioredoxin/glutaredoxin
MSALHVYSRQGCHLCDVLLEQLAPMVAGLVTVEVRDIDTRPEWHERYFLDIPVVEFDGRLVCRHRLDPEAIRELLAQLSGTR